MKKKVWSGDNPAPQGDLESLLFLISISVNVHSKTTDSNKLAPILLAVQVIRL